MADNKNNPPAPPPTSGVTQADLLKAIQEGIAMGIAMAKKEAPPVAEQSQQHVQRRFQNIETCPDCRQLVTACKKQHKTVIALPKDRKWWKWFQGYQLNGVKYLSNAGNHAVTVPADCDIEASIAAWEENEELVRNGRGSIEHDSGSIGIGASGFKPANVPGFRG